METITLTNRELLRLRTAQRVVDRGLTLAEGAATLGLPPMSHPWKGPSYQARINKLARGPRDTSAL